MKKIILQIILVIFIFTAAIPTIFAQSMNNEAKPNLTDDVLETKEFRESRANYLESIYGKDWKELYSRNARSVRKAQEID